MWKMIPQVGKKKKKRNEWVEISSYPPLREFHQKEVYGGPCTPCRNLGPGGGTKYGESRRGKTRKEAVEDKGTANLSEMVT